MTNIILANEYVTDTVGLIVRLEHRQLGPIAEAIFNAAELGTITIYIPAMVFAEILYLGEKNRIAIRIDDVQHYLGRFANIQQYPLDVAAIESAGQITDLPELHDRLIAGTARLLNLPLITNDMKMQKSSFVQTVW